MSERSALLRPALLLAGLGLAAAVVLGGLNRLTEERIADEQRERALASVTAMLAPGSYDNALLDDRIEIGVLGLDRAARVYRARQAGEARAAIFDVTTRQGYSGPIRLLVAVSRDGRVLGVRVLDHRETPGLGDRIEREKSDWIEQFDGHSLGQPPAEGWAADRRGGEFDTLTSATITSTAVIEAVHAVLRTHQTRTETIYATPSQQASP